MPSNGWSNVQFTVILTLKILGLQTLIFSLNHSYLSIISIFEAFGQLLSLFLLSSLEFCLWYFETILRKIISKLLQITFHSYFDVIECIISSRLQAHCCPWTGCFKSVLLLRIYSFFILNGLKGFKISPLKFLILCLILEYYFCYFVDMDMSTACEKRSEKEFIFCYLRGCRESEVAQFEFWP